MKKIYIVGAGGFGRELLWWIKDINKVTPTWEIAGFLDDDPHALDQYECDYGVVGSIKDWQPKEDEEFALALGSPALKRKIVSILKGKGANSPPSFTRQPCCQNSRITAKASSCSHIRSFQQTQRWVIS